MQTFWSDSPYHITNLRSSMVTVKCDKRQRRLTRISKNMNLPFVTKHTLNSTFNLPYTSKLTHEKNVHRPIPKPLKSHQPVGKKNQRTTNLRVDLSQNNINQIDEWKPTKCNTTKNIMKFITLSKRVVDEDEQTTPTWGLVSRSKIHSNSFLRKKRVGHQSVAMERLTKLINKCSSPNYIVRNLGDFGAELEDSCEYSRTMTKSSPVESLSWRFRENLRIVIPVYYKMEKTGQNEIDISTNNTTFWEDTGSDLDEISIQSSPWVFKSLSASLKNKKIRSLAYDYQQSAKVDLSWSLVDIDEYKSKNLIKDIPCSTPKPSKIPLLSLFNSPKSLLSATPKRNLSNVNSSLNVLNQEYNSKLKVLAELQDKLAEENRINLDLNEQLLNHLNFALSW